MKSKLKQLLFIAAITCLLLILTIAGIYKCPLDFIFGIPCPTCGSTRALICLAKSDISGAFYYHPLWPMIIIAIPLFLLYFFEIIHPSRKLITTGCCMISVLLILCYILRQVEGSPIVRIHFETSLIHRFITFIASLR